MPDHPDDVVLTIQIQDGQYHLHTGSSTGDPSWPDTPNGLLLGEETWLAVLTGTQWGPLVVTLQSLNARPVSIDPGWDMAAEWTLNTPDSEITLQTTYGGATTIATPEQWTRLRISVRNRRAAARRAELGEAVLTEPVEQHLIQYWPTTHVEDPAILVGPDEVATMLLEQQEQLHREYGNGPT